MRKMYGGKLESNIKFAISLYYLFMKFEVDKLKISRNFLIYSVLCSFYFVQDSIILMSLFFVDSFSHLRFSTLNGSSIKASNSSIEILLFS